MMLTNSILLGFAAVASAMTCHHDDCLRGVNGTNVEFPNCAQRKADCSAILVTTILPETVTTTITTIGPDAMPTTIPQCGKTKTKTATVTATKYKKTKTITKTVKETVTVSSKCRGGRDMPVTTAAPTSEVPAYATGYCEKFASYSSACACIVEPKTVLLPAPTTTVFVPWTGSQGCGGQ